MHELLEIYQKVNEFGRLMGMELEVIAPGEIKYTMRIGSQHLSNPLAAHGGAVAAIMDGVLGVAALSLAVESEKLVSTVEFKINYFRPVMPGTVLEGHGKVEFVGKRLISASGRIINQSSGELLCTGTGTFNQYPADRIGIRNLS
jgi:uncharacterized protein (TIGR00369 family)